MKTIKKSEVMEKLGKFISVENCASRCTGTAPNQFELTFENGSVFQSYSSLIGVRIGNQYYFTSDHYYSNTTSGYCGRWCGYNCRERRKGLEDGRFILIQ